MNIKDLLIKHEGMALYPYIDSVGKTTIGIGRNIDDNGISEQEALFMLENDLRRVRLELEGYPWYQGLSEVRQNALLDMCFNLGITRFRGFRKMIHALEIGDFIAASIEMLDSRWSQQVGRRATELSMMIREDKYQ